MLYFDHIEAYLNRCPIDPDTPEFRLFKQFLSGLGGLTAYRTEWMIYADAENLAGSIDFCAQDSDGALILFDWKRSKDIMGNVVLLNQTQTCCRFRKYNS